LQSRFCFDFVGVARLSASSEQAAHPLRNAKHSKTSIKPCICRGNSRIAHRCGFNAVVWAIHESPLRRRFGICDFGFVIAFPLAIPTGETLSAIQS
jgi:hypothetical protein